MSAGPDEIPNAFTRIRAQISINTLATLRRKLL